MVVVVVVVVVVGAIVVVVVGVVVVGCVNPTLEVVVGSEYAVVVVVVVVDGSGTVPVVGVCVVVGSVWSCCPLQAASPTDNAIAAIPAVRPTVDLTSIGPPTSVFTMVTNQLRLRASIRLLDSRTAPADAPIPLHRSRRAEMGQQSVAICGRFLTR
ncbi:hypothetical protein [Mycolicibacterium porcinum]|uniref:hypothetical protein n=1 Tax=Mycolicibacterium porcinum TaxID=39693 RepID=UPI001648F85D|nr:hypothetical protein [Mycolicibacterium porcinum]